MPPKVPPSSPAVFPEVPIRPALTRVHQSFPQSTNDAQQKIGLEMVSSKASSSGRRRKHPQGILRTSKMDRKKAMKPSALSRTTSNSSNATASSGISSPVTSVTEMTNLQDASQSGKETDHTSNSIASARSATSSQKGSEAGSAKSKEDWLVEPDFRAKYLEQRKKDRLSAIAGNPIVKGPLKTNATIATASMTAVAIPRTKRGRGRSILVVDSVAPLKSADDDEEEGDSSGSAVPVVESVFAPISEILPTLAGKETFEKPPPFQRTKSQLSLMIEQAKRNAEGVISEQDSPVPLSISSQTSPPPDSIPEDRVHPDDGFEDESEDAPLEMRQKKVAKKPSKSTKPRPKIRNRKSQ
ncbi:hypothetical protein ABW20_dc0105054 [Dactylellina cionopaga]|nr:hypothetical protein ABW20_dc0105054 [Dactylellina cionopaga]